MQGTDQRVAFVAEGLTRRGVQRGDQLGRMALDVGRDGAAVIVDEVHDQEIVRSEMDMRDGEIGEACQLREHVAFELEARPIAARPGFHRKAAPVLKHDREAGQPEPDAQRRGVDDG